MKLHLLLVVIGAVLVSDVIAQEKQAPLTQWEKEQFITGVSSFPSEYSQGRAWRTNAYHAKGMPAVTAFWHANQRKDIKDASRMTMLLQSCLPIRGQCEMWLASRRIFPFETGHLALPHKSPQGAWEGGMHYLCERTCMHILSTGRSSSGAARVGATATSLPSISTDPWT